MAATQTFRELWVVRQTGLDGRCSRAQALHRHPPYQANGEQAVVVERLTDAAIGVVLEVQFQDFTRMQRVWFLIDDSSAEVNDTLDRADDLHVPC